VEKKDAKKKHFYCFLLVLFKMPRRGITFRLTYQLVAEYLIFSFACFRGSKLFQNNSLPFIFEKNVSL
jgi:hypothetical protein